MGRGLSAKIMAKQFPVHSPCSQILEVPTDQFHEADPVHLSSVCTGEKILSGLSRSKLVQGQRGAMGVGGGWGHGQGLGLGLLGVVLDGISARRWARTGKLTHGRLKFCAFPALRPKPKQELNTYLLSD